MTELIQNERVIKKPIRRQTICKICNGELKDASFIERCQHVFCFLCIQKHAAVYNKCPVCDKEFTCYLSNISNNLQCQMFYVKKPTISVEESTKEIVESCCNCQNHQQNTACNHKFCRLCFKQSFLKLNECSVCCERLKELITNENNNMNETTVTSQSNENVSHIEQLSSQCPVLKDSSSHHKVKSEEEQLTEQIELTENSEHRIGQTEDKTNELRFSISNRTALLDRNTFVRSESTNFNSRMTSLEKQLRLTFKQTFNENTELEKRIRNCNGPSSSTLQDETPGQSNCDINFSKLDKIKSLAHEMVNNYSRRNEQSLSINSTVQSSSNGFQKELSVGLCIEPPKIKSENLQSEVIIQELINKSIKLEDPANSNHVIPISSNIHETLQQNNDINFCSGSQKIKSKEKPYQQISERGTETNNKTEVVSRIGPCCPILNVIPNQAKLADLWTAMSKIQSDLKQLKVGLDRTANKSIQKGEKPAINTSFEPILSALDEDKNYYHDSHQTFWEGREYNGKSKHRKNRRFPRGNRGRRRNPQSEDCSCGGHGCGFCPPFWQHETRYRGNRRQYDVVVSRGRSRHQNNVQQGDFCIRGSYSIRRNCKKIHVNATYDGDCPMNEMLQLMRGCESQNSFQRIPNSSFQDYDEPFDDRRDLGYHPYHAEHESRGGYHRKRQRNYYHRQAFLN